VTGHPLDRPVWNCLTGPQAHLARREGQAVVLDPAIGPFAACADGTAEGLEVRPDGPFWLVETAAVAPPTGLVLGRAARLTQMVAENPVIGDVEAGLLPLGESDAEDMARLAHATQPGPWSSSTQHYGGFYGIREGGELIAMAGTRMRPSTLFAEVSGVCTAPAARGRGLARRLMMRVMADMVARQETPFLHSYSANDGAIRLYRSLGFVERRQMVVTILEAA
jgi:GNAT superfamily N-acetyltransferase